MPNAIIPKTNGTTGSSASPTSAVLAFGEVASNKFTGDIFIKKEDGTVINVVTSKAGSATPAMDGTAAVGTSLLYARQDHVHQSDTSRLAVSGGDMTGSLSVRSSSTTKEAGYFEYNAIGGLKDAVGIKNFGSGNSLVVNKEYGVVSVSVDAGGTGYNTPPSVIFSSPPLGGRAAVATATVSGGAVTSVVITDPGDYTGTLGPTITLFGGNGNATATAVMGDSLRNAVTVNKSGHVGISTPVDSSVALSVDTTGIKFASDASVQIAAANPASVSPLMDGTAAVGSSALYARQDHVHPTDTSRLAASQKGSANGVCPLDATGKVDAVYLPSYVDDVIEVTSLPASGETGKIYVRTTDNTQHRWSGSVWIQITSGGSPTGTATGDLSGSYPSPTVAKIQGRAVASTAPTTTGQALVWNSGTTQYEPTLVIRDGDTITGGTY